MVFCRESGKGDQCRTFGFAIETAGVQSGQGIPSSSVRQRKSQNIILAGLLACYCMESNLPYATGHGLDLNMVEDASTGAFSEAILVA